MQGATANGSTTIRRAQVADAPSVHAILLAARHEIPLAENFADQAHQDWVRGQCRRRNVWVADRGGAIAGVMVLAVNEIFYLAVSQPGRRQGIGRVLVQFALAYIKRRRWGGAKAKTREGNAAVISLLLSLGFKPAPDLVAAPGWQVFSWGSA